MKRWILLLLVLALLACLAGARAEKHGAVVTVKLTVLENSEKAVGATVTLHWNSEALRFVSATAQGGTAPTEAAGSFVFAGDSELSGTVGTASFLILPETALGHYLVTPVVSEAVNAAGEAVPLRLRCDFIQVEEGSVPTPTPTPVPTPVPTPLSSGTDAPDTAEGTAQPDATQAPLSGKPVDWVAVSRPGVHIGAFEFTACSIGPRFRDVREGSTDKWWMFTPIDLTQPGLQTYDLIAGNLHYIGTVTVRVDSESLTVDYRLVDGAIHVVSESLSVLTELPEQLEEGSLPAYSFGRPIRFEQLDGADCALLLLRNKVSYHTGQASLVTRFYPDSEEYALLAGEMLRLLGGE